AKARLILKNDRLPRVPFASLASPWAKLCRVLRTLVDSCNLEASRLRSSGLPLLFFSISIALILSAPVLSQRRVDDPDDQEDLNRELWEFAKHSPYESIQSYIKDAQRASRATQAAEVELPTGWRITPAGTQVEVGRLPYEMVQFA